MAMLGWELDAVVDLVALGWCIGWERGHDGRIVGQ